MPRRPPEPPLNRPLLLFVALAGLAMAIALLAVGCSDPEPTPTPTPTPSPTPTPAPAVRGAATTDSVLVDPTGVVDHKDPPEPRQEVIEQFVAQIQRELDNHLTRLGREGRGTLGRIRATQVPGIEPELTSELATPQRWVVEATYAIMVGHRGDPLWAEVTTRLVRSDGSTASPTLVFLMGNDQTPELVAWEATVTVPDLPTPTGSPAAPSPAPSRTVTP